MISSPPWSHFGLRANKNETYPEQIVVHFFGVVVFLSMHGHKKIFDIHNGTEQLINLFVCDVPQMRDMTVQCMSTVGVSALLRKFRAIIVLHILVAILLRRFPASASAIRCLTRRVHGQFGKFLGFRQFVNLP